MKVRAGGVLSLSVISPEMAPHARRGRQLPARAAMPRVACLDEASRASNFGRQGTSRCVGPIQVSLQVLEDSGASQLEPLGGPAQSAGLA